MKSYKLLLIALIVLLLIIFIGILIWLASQNSKPIDPLPITANKDDISVNDGKEDSSSDDKTVLHIRADTSMQVPLDDIVVNFEARYPHTQILVDYVPTKSLLNVTKDRVALSPTVTDILIAEEALSTERLLPLQSRLNSVDSNQVSASDSAVENGTTDISGDAVDSMESRSLVSFNYALKGEQPIDGVILTNNPAAVSFRNFMLSSDGQDILEQYEYRNIDGYQNAVDDLFKPTSSSDSSGDNLEFSEVLSN